MRITLLRHGQRTDYANPLYWMVCVGQPWSDAPLTPAGYQSAWQVGQEWARTQPQTPTHIYCSPYLRTLSTATAVTEGLRAGGVTVPAPILSSALSEFQPETVHRLHLYPDGIPEITLGDRIYLLPETTLRFEQRVEAYLRQLVAEHGPDDHLLLVTHGAWVRSVSHLLANRAAGDLSPLTEIPYLTEITYLVEDGEPQLETVHCSVH